MEAIQTILSRRSVRQYKPDPVPVEALEQILAAAQAAPYGTAGDEREFVVLSAEAKDDFLAFLSARLDALLPALEDAPAKGVLRNAQGLARVVAGAPVIVAVFTSTSDEGYTLAYPSAAMAAENLMLAATTFGLATCYISGGAYLSDDIAEYLGMVGRELVCLMPVGYAQSTPKMKPRPADAVTWRGFPEKAEAAEPRAPRSLAFTPALGAGEGHRVLFVDDSNAAADQLADCLEQAGYAVERCNSAACALEAIANQPPDAVIIDALLPETSGYALCRQIRERYQGFLPIAVVTTAYNVADVTHGLASGADDVIPKPIVGQEVLAALHSLMRTKALYDEVQQRTEELRLANEHLREFDRLQQDLTHMIVHDLRTPLTNIIGNLQTLEMAEYEPELTREFVPTAIEAGQMLLSMVNDLLDVHKLESGEMPLDITEFAAADVLKAAVDNVQSLAVQKGLELSWHAEPEDLRLSADEDKIRRALINLIGNAVKFTAKGYVRVGARREGDVVRFSIEDSGEGIPEADRERIFAKFGQVATRKAGRKMSTGLGLTFVKLAAEAHGGRVWVESELGKGSTFWLELRTQNAKR